MVEVINGPTSLNDNDFSDCIMAEESERQSRPIQRGGIYSTVSAGVRESNEPFQRKHKHYRSTGFRQKQPTVSAYSDPPKAKSWFSRAKDNVKNKFARAKKVYDLTEPLITPQATNEALNGDHKDVAGPLFQERKTIGHWVVSSMKFGQRGGPSDEVEKESLLAKEKNQESDKNEDSAKEETYAVVPFKQPKKNAMVSRLLKKKNGNILHSKP